MKYELAGQQFGKLTVLRPARGRPRFWVCQCECGGQAVVRQDYLMGDRGQTKCKCALNDARKVWVAGFDRYEQERERRSKLRKEMKAAGYL